MFNQAQRSKQFFFSVVTVSLLVIFSTKVHAQEGAYWQGLSTENPAAIGTPSDWIYANYVSLNFEDVLSGFSMGADYLIDKNTGTFGINFMRLKVGYEKVDQMNFNYAYTLTTGYNDGLSFGASVGLRTYTNPLNENELPLATGFNGIPSDVDGENIKGAFGIYYNTDNFDLGFCYNHYFELESTENKYNDYSVESAQNFFSAQANYRFSILNFFVIEPNLLVDYLDKTSDLYPGIFLNYNQRVWAGYSSLNFDEAHSIQLGFALFRTFRFGYSYDFTQFLSNEDVNIHEFTLGVKLN